MKTSPTIVDYIQRRYYYTKEKDGNVYLYESINGEPFIKKLTPFKDFPFVVATATGFDPV